MTKSVALGELIEQLHEANRQLSDAARPLDRLEELPSDQREQLAKQLRAALERWEGITEQISQVLR